MPSIDCKFNVDFENGVEFSLSKFGDNYQNVKYGEIDTIVDTRG